MAIIQDITGANAADINADGELAVALSKLLGKAGYGVFAGETHDGAAGLPALRRSIYASPDKRLGVGMDSVLFEDVFHHAVNNSRKYALVNTTMTAVMAGGVVSLNAGASAASAAGVSMRSYRSVPLLGNFQLAMDFAFSLNLAPQAQNNIEIGIAIAGATALVAPTDGVYMLIDTAGALQLVANYNGTATSSGAIAFAWTANRMYHGEIVLHTDRAELYIDGVYLGEVPRSAAYTVGAMAMNQSGHLYARIHNAAATAGAQKLNLARWSATLGDGNFNRPWGAAMSCMGNHFLSAPDGQAVAQLANLANSAAPASAALSNTAAGYTTLGGNFQFAALAGAETDYALFAWQNPAGTPALPGRNAIVTGVDIDTFNMGAAVATTPTLLNWYLGIGSTGVSLATADAATTRAPHRRALGAQALPIGTVVGGHADRFIDADFSVAPLVCEPGSFIHLILRMPVGTATASQIVRGMAAVRGYFE